MLNNLINSFQKNKFLNISWSNPCFLCELIKKHHAVKSLRHKNIMLLDEHRIETYGHGSFSCAALHEWNKLPLIKH